MHILNLSIQNKKFYEGSNVVYIYIYIYIRKLRIACTICVVHIDNIRCNTVVLSNSSMYRIYSWQTSVP